MVLRRPTFTGLQWLRNRVTERTRRPNKLCGEALFRQSSLHLQMTIFTPHTSFGLYFREMHPVHILSPDSRLDVPFSAMLNNLIM